MQYVSLSLLLVGLSLLLLAACKRGPVKLCGRGTDDAEPAPLVKPAVLSRIVAMVRERHALAPLRSYAVVHAHAGAEAAALARRLEAVLGFPPLHVSEISVVVGMNAGRGALSVVAMSE